MSVLENPTSTTSESLSCSTTMAVTTTTTTTATSLTTTTNLCHSQPNTATTATATHTEPSSSSNLEGIHVQEALQILSLRHSHSHHHDHHHHHDVKEDTKKETTSACHVHIPQGGKEMGQTIDMFQQGQTKSEFFFHQEQERLAKERQERFLEIQSTLTLFSIKQLLQAVLEAQRGRVMTYKEYDKGLEHMLSNPETMPQYPILCSDVTATFAVYSDTIHTVQTILEQRHEQQKQNKNRGGTTNTSTITTLKNVKAWIVSLQQYEREKLNLTAALHLEQIRLVQEQQQQEQEQNSNHAMKLKQENDTTDRTTTTTTDTPTTNDRVTKLLKESILSLKARMTKCIESINEVLEELRYAMMEEEDNEE